MGQSYPSTRLRRIRQNPWIRSLVAENRLNVSDLIWPCFVADGAGICSEINSMPGVHRLSIDRLKDQAVVAASLGIPAIAIFPQIEPDQKDEMGSLATNPDNLVCRAVGAIKELNLGLGVICDVALDPFTNHGHDGLLRDGTILNDETIDLLCRQAIVQADAGCDVIAPSDMMDGRIGRIRHALDQAGHQDVLLLSYAAKYASSFYGPFRDAIGSSSSLASGDKKSYQMDPANTLEATREVALDIDEGADMVMIKPGMPYLDIVNRIKTEFSVPTFAYQVSGEYAMIAGAADRGWLDRRGVVLESLTSFKRAGCDGILTYFAVEAAKYLNDD